MVGGPRVADPHVFGKSKEKLANVLVGGLRVADLNSFSSHWQVNGEDWQMFWREGQGWQIKTVLRVIAK